MVMHPLPMSIWCDTIAADVRRVARSRTGLAEFGTVHSRAFPFMLISIEEQRDPYLEPGTAGW